MVQLDSGVGLRAVLLIRIRTHQRHHIIPTVHTSGQGGFGACNQDIECQLAHIAKPRDTLWSNREVRETGIGGGMGAFLSVPPLHKERFTQTGMVGKEGDSHKERRTLGLTRKSTQIRDETYAWTDTQRKRAVTAETEAQRQMIRDTDRDRDMIRDRDRDRDT